MLKIKNLNSFYGDIQVLRGLELSLLPGEVHCLFGRNGAGKTTLMKSIMGMVSCNGTITMGGTNLIGQPAYKVPTYGIGYVPQGRRLFSELTVSENLEIGLMANKNRTFELDQVFEFFPLLKKRLKQIAGTLSGGEQQMLAIARALAIDPKVMLLDEPTEGLMPSMIQTIRYTVEKLKNQGVAILLVEQRIDAILSIADEISFIENGKVKDHFSADEAKQTPDRLANLMSLGGNKKPLIK
jgi:branched-chain amino acid transport system ATP-binding protein